MSGTFEGVGSLQFSPDNKFAQGFSGIVDVAGDELTLLQFNTESEYIIGTVQFHYSGVQNTNPDYRYKIKFNDVIVHDYLVGNSAYYTSPDNFIPIMIPSFTNVKLTAENVADTSSYPISAAVVGEVHGAIEQENLESVTNNNKWASL